MSSIFSNVPTSLKDGVLYNSASAVEADDFGLPQLKAMSVGLNISCVVANAAALYEAALESSDVEVEYHTQEVMDINEVALGKVLDSLESISTYSLEDKGEDKAKDKDNDEDKGGIVKRSWAAIKRFLTGIKDWFAKQWRKLTNFVRGIFGYDKKIDAALSKADTVQVSVASIQRVRERSQAALDKVVDMEGDDAAGLGVHAKSSLSALDELLKKKDGEKIVCSPAEYNKVRASVKGFLKALQEYSSETEADAKALLDKTVSNIREQADERRKKKALEEEEKRLAEIKNKNFFARALGSIATSFKEVGHKIKVLDREGSVVEIK